MIRSTAAIGFAVTVSTVAMADDAVLPVPEGPVVLTVTGDIGVTNDGNAALFDMAMLRALETRIYATETIWTYGLQAFTGVPLRAIADAVGTDAESLTASALNDYSVRIPHEDWDDDGAMIAFLQNGLPMPTREMGPLWIIYPYDSVPAMRTESIFARSVWQLTHLDFGS